MRLESNTLLGDLPQPIEAENLKAATVGENRFVPTHKSMKAPGVSENLLSGSERQVVRVPQDNLRTDLLQLAWLDAFDRSLGAYWKKDRGLDDPVIGVN